MIFHTKDISMGRMNDVIIRYAEIQGIPPDQIPTNVTLAAMLQAIDRQAVTVPVSASLDKATRPPIPWLTIKSYVEVALETTNLSGWTVTVIEQKGLAVTWEDYLIEVSVLVPSLSRAQQPLFQVKLFEAEAAPEKPLAIEFKRHYPDRKSTRLN